VFKTDLENLTDVVSDNLKTGFKEGEPLQGPESKSLTDFLNEYNFDSSQEIQK
jgi:hypothetical protein